MISVNPNVNEVPEIMLLLFR